MSSYSHSTKSPKSSKLPSKLSKKKSQLEATKVVVIGTGRFGNALAQGLKDSFIKREDGSLATIDRIEHVSARQFTSLSPMAMADAMQDAVFVMYCGCHLQDYAEMLAGAMKEAAATSLNGKSEFIDFSNPCPVNEASDVGGAIKFSTIMNGGDNGINDVSSNFKIWKLTNVGSLEVADAEFCRQEVLVYGDGIAKGEIPRLVMPGIIWVPGPVSKWDLMGEAHHRIMERAEIDRWYDAALLGFGMFLFTSVYAIVRYHVKLNGSEPTENIVMYLLDKGYAWTGLWMMVMSPMAGNFLSIASLYRKWNDLAFIHQCVTLLSSILMIIPAVFISVTYIFWIALRGLFFTWTRGTAERLYQRQPSKLFTTPTNAFFKSTMVDMVSMKGETGNVGFVYALIHSFIGFIVADVAYKGYWFVGEKEGRLGWRFELSMMTGCVSTAILWCVAMRSLFGKASWIKLKPLYSYMSPFGVWLATIHVMAFGAKGWNTLFNKDYHNGQMSITFVSSMLPACTLLVHHMMGFFGTRKQCSDIHLWKHSLNEIATQDFAVLARQLDMSTGGYIKGGSDRRMTLSQHHSYTSRSRYRHQSTTASHNTPSGGSSGSEELSELEHDC